MVRTLFVGLAVLLSACSTTGGRVNTGWFGNTAINGYDPVAYFVAGEPQQGRDEFVSQYDGASWKFASAANKAKFDANPQKYAPQYGGYCAYAVANNDTAGIDPQAWSIVDGKLYLNYSESVQAEWEAQQAAHIQAADRNWPGLKN